MFAEATFGRVPCSRPHGDVLGPRHLRFALSSVRPLGRVTSESVARVWIVIMVLVPSAFRLRAVPAPSAGGPTSLDLEERRYAGDHHEAH